MTITLAFPLSDISFFLVFVLLELDSDLSTHSKNTSREKVDKHFFVHYPVFPKKMFRYR